MSLVRLVGEKAIAQAAGTAISRPSSVEPTDEDDRVHEWLEVVLLRSGRRE